MTEGPSSLHTNARADDAGNGGSHHQPPLCVDLDGTLIASDTLADSFCLMIRQSPLTVFQAPFWLLRGWPRLKDEMVARTLLPVANLPYRPEVLRHLRREQERGRRVLLVTASAQRIGEEVAAATGLFTEVIGSAHGEGLRGTRKAERLVQRFGVGGFDYMGDCGADLAIWAKARKSLVVGGERLVEQARRVGEVEAVFAIRPARASTWLEAMGGSPWLRPLVLLSAAFLFGTGEGHGVIAIAALMATVLCLGSAAFALLDGLMAITTDRADPQRRHRPFASGRLPVLPGVLLFGTLLLAAAGMALLLPWPWSVALVGYVVLGVALPFLRNERTGVAVKGDERRAGLPAGPVLAVEIEELRKGRRHVGKGAPDAERPGASVV